MRCRAQEKRVTVGGGDEDAHSGTAPGCRAHGGGEEHEGGDDDMEGAWEEVGPAPGCEGRLVLQDGGVQLRHHQLDDAAAWTTAHLVNVSIRVQIERVHGAAFIKLHGEGTGPQTVMHGKPRTASANRASECWTGMTGARAVVAGVHVQLTQVAPAVAEGGGGADHVGGEHDGAPVLAAHEGGQREADDASLHDEARRAADLAHTEHCAQKGTRASAVCQVAAGTSVMSGHTHWIV